MIIVSKAKALLSLFVCFNFLLCSVAVGDGMQPETTVVVLNEADGEASINVTNTDATRVAAFDHRGYSRRS